MRLTSEQPVRDVFGGRTLAGLMSLYEENYVRMWRLLQGHEPAGRGAVSRTPGDLDLHLSVLERHRYTTTYHLTYYFTEDGVLVPDPDLHVRVYRDARMAETVHCGRNSHLSFLRPYRLNAGSWLQRRWEMNLLLSKWLSYCIGKGHRFRVSGHSSDPLSV